MADAQRDKRSKAINVFEVVVHNTRSLNDLKNKKSLYKIKHPHDTQPIPSFEKPLCETLDHC